MDDSKISNFYKEDDTNFTGKNPMYATSSLQTNKGFIPYYLGKNNTGFTLDDKGYINDIISSSTGENVMNKGKTDTLNINPIKTMQERKDRKQNQNIDLSYSGKPYYRFIHDFPTYKVPIENLANKDDEHDELSSKRKEKERLLTLWNSEKITELLNYVIDNPIQDYDDTNTILELMNLIICIKNSPFYYLSQEENYKTKIIELLNRLLSYYNIDPLQFSEEESEETKIRKAATLLYPDLFTNLKKSYANDKQAELEEEQKRTMADNEDPVVRFGSFYPRTPRTKGGSSKKKISKRRLLVKRKKSETKRNRKRKSKRK